MIDTGQEHRSLKRAPTWRPSSDPHSSLESRFYAKNSKSIDWLFKYAVNFNDDLDEIADLYVVQRESALFEDRPIISPSFRDELEDVGDGTDDTLAQLGPVERKFLEDLEKEVPDRVTYLIGDIGVGKSYFQRFMLLHYGLQIESIARAEVLFLNCLEISNIEMTRQEVLEGIFDLLYDARGQRKKSHFRSSATVDARVISDYISNERPKNKARTIVCFDNLDQLPLETNRVLVDLSRLLHLQNCASIVVAMRPTTYGSIFGRQYFDRGAFPRRAIELPPPSLTAVLDRRRRYCATRKMRKHFDLGAMTTAFNLVANSHTQDVIRGLAGTNTRDRLDIAKRLLMSGFNAEKSEVSTSHPAFEQIVRRVSDHDELVSEQAILHAMLGPDRVFDSDSDDIPICNPFFFSSKDQPPDYTIFHVLLCFLYWDENPQSVRSVVKKCEQFAIPLDYVREALNALLVRRLISCLESEDRVELDRHVTITKKGGFYVESLYEAPAAFLACVFDTPANHYLDVVSALETVDDSIWMFIADSISEILESVLESDQLYFGRYLRRRRSQLSSLWILLEFGLPSRRLSNSAIALLDAIEDVAKNSEVSRLCEKARRVVDKIEGLENSLHRRESREGRFLPREAPSSEQVTSQFSRTDNPLSFVRHPRRFRPGSKKMELSYSYSAGDTVDAITAIVKGYFVSQDTSGDTSEREHYFMYRLPRAEIGRFVAEVSINDEHVDFEDLNNLSKVEVRLFEGPKPIDFAIIEGTS